MRVVWFLGGRAIGWWFEFFAEEDSSIPSREGFDPFYSRYPHTLPGVENFWYSQRAMAGDQGIESTDILQYLRKALRDVSKLIGVLFRTLLVQPLATSRGRNHQVEQYDHACWSSVAAQASLQVAIYRKWSLWRLLL
jgi:hypothetical protein